MRGLSWVLRLFSDRGHQRKEDARVEHFQRMDDHREDEELQREIEERRRRFRDELAVIMHDREERDH